MDNEHIIGIGPSMVLEAAKYAAEKTKGYPSSYEGVFIGRFTELIVGECIRICEEGDNTQTTSGGAAQMIKQHFDIQ